jgi:hypothetical protein
VAIAPEVAKARVIERKTNGGHGPSDRTMARRITDYASFASEGYSVVAVRGDDEVVISVRTVIEQADKLL